MAGERQWRWDGSNWTYWDGEQWVVGQPEPGEIPGVDQVPHPPTPPAPPPTPQPAAPAPQAAAAAPAAAMPAQASGGGGLSGAGIAAIVLGSLLGLVLIGGGIFLLSRILGGADDDVVTLRAEPINTATAAFTPPVGTDLTVTPTTSNGVRTVNADTAGLYGGTLNNASCNQDQLITFLQQNPDKAAAWAGVFGIPVADIPTFVKSLTPVVLVADTAVTNHGFDNGRATSVPAVLQAGTAVLVDKYGTPTVKCYCGNPLLPPPALGQVRYTGTQWPGFTPGAVTVVQASSVVIQNFILVDVVSGQTIVRPAGSTGATDTVQGATPAPAPAATTPAPAPVTPTAPAAESGRESQAIQLAAGRLDQCQLQILGDATEYVPVLQDPALSFSAVPTGQGPGLYTVRMDISDGDAFQYTVNVDSGAVVPADPGSADLTLECPGVFD